MNAECGCSFHRCVVQSGWPPRRIAWARSPFGGEKFYARNSMKTKVNTSIEVFDNADLKNDENPVKAIVQ